MLVLAVLGIVFGIALPSLSGALDRIEVGAAANHLVAAHQRARMMAITRSQVLVLTVDRLVLDHPRRGQDQRRSGPKRVQSASRVALAGPARQFTFSPEGFTLGLSNATLRLTRGSATGRDRISSGKDSDRALDGRTSGGRRPLRADGRPGCPYGSGPFSA